MEKLTRHEREIVEEAVSYTFERLSELQLLLGGIWEDYFSGPKQERIYPGDAERIGQILYLIESSMFDLVRDYYMMVGKKNFRGVDYFLATAEQAKQTFEANDLLERAYAAKLLTKKDVDDIAGLPDAEAIKKLKALIGGKEK